MTATFYSAPYQDPAQVGRKNNPDWLVNEVGTTEGGRYAVHHRFFAEDRARTFAQQGQELLEERTV